MTVPDVLAWVHHPHARYVLVAYGLTLATLLLVAAHSNLTLRKLKKEFALLEQKYREFRA